MAVFNPVKAIVYVPVKDDANTVEDGTRLLCRTYHVLGDEVARARAVVLSALQRTAFIRLAGPDPCILFAVVPGLAVKKGLLRGPPLLLIFPCTQNREVLAQRGETPGKGHHGALFAH